VEKPYHVVEKKDTQGLANFLVKNGQALLPMLEFIEQSQVAVDEFIDVVGRATLEALLRLSAEGVAGAPHPGKKGGAIGWHGGEPGTICLKERKLRVKRPRLRKKGEKKGGEVPVPAYEAMRADGKLGSRMLEILLRGVSTRQYAKVLPEMAETVGVSRSSVSREAIEASEAELKRLCERRLDDLELLVLYVDGVIFGEHHVLGAVGVDAEGGKHVLGLAEGASQGNPCAFGKTCCHRSLRPRAARAPSPPKRYPIQHHAGHAHPAHLSGGPPGRPAGSDRRTYSDFQSKVLQVRGETSLVLQGKKNLRRDDSLGRDPRPGLHGVGVRAEIYARSGI